MIGFYLTLPFVFIGFLRLLIAIFNYFSRPFLPGYKPVFDSKISVLVHARNEEENIGNLLNDLINQSYKNFEIIVYEDLSTDKTLQIVNDFATKHQNIQIIFGKPLPDGWLGKNYSSYNLANKATGEYLMFLDANVRLEPRHLEKSLAFIQKNKLVLLSMFPKQILITFGEKITVPIMQWVLLTLMPLRCVNWSMCISFSAVNRQMMMFESSDYKKFRWHEKFKSNPVEDILISKDIKRNRLKTYTLLGSDDISCRMYKNYEEAINGFSKNICQFFGGSSTTMLSFALFTTFAPILVILFQPYPLVFLYLLSVIFSRMLIAALTEHSTLQSILYLPLQQFALIKMVIKSLKLQSKVGLERKRKLVLNKRDK